MLKNTKQETIQLLLESSIKAMIFNIILSFLLTLSLKSQTIPSTLLLSWFIAITIISSIRILLAKQELNTLMQKNQRPNLQLFLLLVFITGSVWGCAYIIMLPYLNERHELIIILVLGGITAGAITSLSTYLPAYYAYVFPILLPVIVLNFIHHNTERTILATMMLFYLIMVSITAKINNRLIYRVIALVTENKTLIDKLTLLTLTDPLTGLFNRRSMEDTLNKGLRIAKRQHNTLSVVSIDVDNFKLLNDNFGHPYGDEFLIKFATLLKNMVRRATDTTFRIGGDEFAIVFANLPLDDTLIICEKIKTQLYAEITSNIKDAQQTEILNKITLSMGILYIHDNAQISNQEIMSEADKALYQAKTAGKNKIIVQEVVAPSD